MPKQVTINIPSDEGPITATGYVAWLYIGFKKYKFVLQHMLHDTTDTRRPSILAHYASGYKLKDLSGDVLLRYVQTGYRDRHPTREYRKAAQSWLDMLTAEKGDQYVLDKLASVPVLN